MKDIKESVEEFGVLIEKLGRSPMESRVFSYLLLAEPPYASFDEIKEFLKASKSSISNSLSVLQKDGSVSYRTFSGDRKRYFMINTKDWEQKLIDGAKNLSAFNVLLKNALVYRKNSKFKEFNDGINEVLEFQEYLTKEIDIAIKKWLKK